MSSYSELIKNFEKIRSYMREFYVYGFKSRGEYDAKSARSYDDERRRVESWLGDYMRFVRTPEGKTVFLSIDSRVTKHNPLYKALKAKSFTDGDITLHFILFDILYAPDVALPLPALLEKIDGYLSGFASPMVFDESTVRKKLKEYRELGLIAGEKRGRQMVYRRSADTDLTGLSEVLHFFSEAAPCGVVGSFLLDKTDGGESPFGFKHHYITSALDSHVTAALFTAMRLKSAVTVTKTGRRADGARTHRIIPLRIFVSVQNGRQHLLAYRPETNAMQSYRLDYLSDVKIEEPTPRFDELRAELDAMQAGMWGVLAGKGPVCEPPAEHVSFTVTIGDGESHIVRRLEREKRIGRIERLDDRTYRFTADLYDASEIVPWIRTFICRITDLRFSDPETDARFKDDLREMYRLYGLTEDET